MNMQVTREVANAAVINVLFVCAYIVISNIALVDYTKMHYFTAIFSV